MVALSLHRWLLRPGLAGLLLLLWAASAGQAPATEIHYLKDLSFRIPFVINPAQQRLIRQVALYVSEDEGRSYKVYANAQPAETSFLFHALHQGWYWFTVQAQYLDGHNMPADPMTAQPGLKICVDSIAPAVVLRQTQSRDGALGVEWDIRDENPDLMSVHLDYRPVGAQDWIPLSQAPSVLYNQFGWTPTVNATQYEVRLQVRDRAGNAAEKVIQLTPGAPRSQPPPDPAVGVTASSAGNRVTMINSRSIKLNYSVEEQSVGKSGVAVIEVWVKRGLSGRWEKVKDEVPQKDAPYLLVKDVEEGRYGFLLIARSGVGKGERPPGPNDPPDLWVEVDVTKPVVKVFPVEVGGTPEQPRVTILWDAQDKFLTDRPITISYSDKPDNPNWTPLPGVSLPLANARRYDWLVPRDFDLHSFYLRVEAIDQAGNLGHDDSKLVVVDLATPKARIRGAEVAPAVPGGPPPTAPGGMSGVYLNPTHGAGTPGTAVMQISSVGPAPLPAAAAPAPGPLPAAVETQPAPPPAPATAPPLNAQPPGPVAPLPPNQASPAPTPLLTPGGGQPPSSLPPSATTAPVAPK